MYLVIKFYILTNKKSKCNGGSVTWFPSQHDGFFALSGAAFLTPDSEAPPTITSDPRPLGELIHAALMSKKYLGQSSGNIGETSAYEGHGN